MPLSRAERFKLKSLIRQEMLSDHNTWDYQQQGMLLGEFGLTFDDDRFGDGPAFEDIIANLPDADLVEMYSIVSGIPQKKILDTVEAEDAENWKQGYVRLFISHSAQYKAFVAGVSAELAIVGIDGFVAHESMTISKPWQTQIERALKSMHAFVAIVHPEFVESAWCNQEVGWALGRRVPKYVIRMGKDPYGFIGSDQWPSRHNQSAEAVGATIIDWAATIPELNETMIDGLFSAVGAANNYFTAEAAAKRIAKLGNLTDAQWDQLRDVYWSTITSTTECCRTEPSNPSTSGTARNSRRRSRLPRPGRTIHGTPTTMSRRSSDRSSQLLLGLNHPGGRERTPKPADVATEIGPGTRYNLGVPAVDLQYSVMTASRLAGRRAHRFLPSRSRVPRPRTQGLAACWQAAQSLT